MAAFDDNPPVSLAAIAEDEVADELGFGYARMNETQLEDWAHTDLSQASAHRSTDRVALQEAQWKKEVNVDGRANWSIREAVRLHADRFQDSVRDFGVIRMLVSGLAQPSSKLNVLPSSALAQVVDMAWGFGSIVDWVVRWPCPVERAESSVRVVVRKRPLLSFERARDEWDCVEMDPMHGSVLCHDGRLARNGKRLVMVHRRYLLDKIWDESASNVEVATDTVLPLLQWAQSGHCSTLLCYGQTGTGKTHTLGGALELLAEKLDEGLEDADAQFFEVRGQKLYDLLNERAEVHLRADAEGHFALRGAKRVPIGCEHGGLAGTRATLSSALALRTSEATERNAASSRSHAILVIWLKKGGGMLRLVDLAGSERNYETEQMTAAQHRESAEINSSLMALKDCFRAHAALKRGEKARPPYRASRLTQCLKDCFEDVSHRFTLVATVGPASTDVIHTANTLNHAVMMAQALEAAKTELTLDLPLGTGRIALGGLPISQWTADDVRGWTATVERGRFAQLVLPPQLDGRGLLALSAQGLAKLFEGDLRRGRGEGEGTAWNVTGYEEGQGSGIVLGKALFAAVRREALAGVARNKMGANASDSLLL